MLWELTYINGKLGVWWFYTSFRQFLHLTWVWLFSYNCIWDKGNHSFDSGKIFILTSSIVSPWASPPSHSAIFLCLLWATRTKDGTEVYLQLISPYLGAIKGNSFMYLSGWIVANSWSPSMTAFSCGIFCCWSLRLNMSYFSLWIIVSTYVWLSKYKGDKMSLNQPVKHSIFSAYSNDSAHL